MNRRALLTVPLLAAAATMLAAGSCQSDVEDCDAEDRRNNEPECRTSNTKTRTKKKKSR
jgi:hypothetical protein